MTPEQSKQKLTESIEPDDEQNAREKFTVTCKKDESFVVFAESRPTFCPGCGVFL